MNESGQPITVGNAIKLANSHLQAGRMGEAELIYRQVLAVNPDHFEALHFLGVIASQAGKYEQAVELIRRALQQQPSSHAALSNLGDVLVKLKCPEEAVATFRKAIALKPDYFYAHYNLGCILLQQGQTEEAIEALEKARSLQSATKLSIDVPAGQPQRYARVPGYSNQSGITLFCDGCSELISVDNWWHCLDCDENLCVDCHSQPGLKTVRHCDTHITTEYRRPAELSAHETKEAILECSADLQLKLVRQNGVCTFFDYTLGDYLSSAMTPQGQLTDQAGLLLDYLARRRAGRFVDFFARKAAFGTEIPAPVYNMSQGVGECLQWKGQVLFKSVFDVAIYQTLIAELRPMTIIEIGSGNGGSAIWFADLMRCFNIEGHVYSMDIRAPSASDQRVTFREGDCGRIETVFHDAEMAAWPRPWLVVEDAHVNVPVVLEFFDRFLRRDDYLVVEDSVKKENILGRFLLGKKDKYRVDTRYTDMLGKNATSCLDSILRHM